jgi:hypothetical protein
VPVANGGSFLRNAVHAAAPGLAHALAPNSGQIPDSPAGFLDLVSLLGIGLYCAAAQTIDGDKD